MTLQYLGFPFLL